MMETCYVLGLNQETENVKIWTSAQKHRRPICTKNYQPHRFLSAGLVIISNSIISISFFTQEF